MENSSSANTAFQITPAELSGKAPFSGLILRSQRFLKEACDLVCFEQEQELLSPTSITLQARSTYCLTLPCRNGPVTALLHTVEGEQSLAWDLTLSGAEQELAIHFPFLERLTLGPGARRVDWHALTDRRGSPLGRYLNYQSPYLIANAEESLVLFQSGTLVENEEYYPARLTGSPGLPAAVHPQPTAVYQASVELTGGGWRGAFASIRASLRTQIDLSEYSRPDLQWYSEQFVQHFTFLYGQEILDQARGEFDLERFLDDGERDFGGYDGFLIWGVYPRIGVDERTQWDFYDDLPGGREGLRAMSRRARERGARFFVPYKPWDRSAELHGVKTWPDEVELARLIEDTEADGVFLDTMSAINPEFRQEIDRHKPGVVFCAEGRALGRARELVTGCWEQSYTRDWKQGNWSAVAERMPQVDLWRFVLPEQRLFVINRHSTAGDRMRILQRGFFNGMGWVVWQDIFGLTLPYTPAEAGLLKKCASIFRENRAAVNSPAPTPLVETLVDGLYANEFPAETRRMWTFYNENDHPLSAEVLRVEPRENTHFFDAWNERELSVDLGVLQAYEISARDLGCVIEYPRLIERSPEGVRAPRAEPQPGMRLVIRQAGRESTLPMTHADWQHGPWVNSGRVVVRLYLRDQVLDQILIDGENENDNPSG